MSGKNQRISAGQTLFKAGDASNGMYLVRSGELVVYLEQQGSKVVLAKVTAGGMIGEMALFDQKPRSASVMASVESEVTLISLEDFNKLMKQIPKWFVGLMATLSTRLRSTNERLQTLEGKQNVKEGAFAGLVKVLHLLNLLWHSSGIKEGKEWLIEQGPTRNTIATIFSMEHAEIDGLISKLIKVGMISQKKDTYNNDVLAIQNRGQITRFIGFLSEFAGKHPMKKGLNKDELSLLSVLKKASDDSAYEQVSISLDDLQIQAVKSGLNISNIEQAAENLTIGSDVLQIVKIGSNKKGIKVNRKEIAQHLQFHSAASQIAA